ncbi:hypothetical protein L218DRAFT_535371 [Marasmius fiardii PR-910]|nr:hypothetical protein L218DRAFT_535371 [Marasmius fiardii PR-910]
MPNKFMVTFKPDTPESEIDDYAKEVEKEGGTIVHRFESTLKGFTATIPDSHLDKLKNLQGGPIVNIGMKPFLFYKDYNFSLIALDLEPDGEVKIQ